MEREGLVVRLVDPEDARATLVDITAAGRALRAEPHQSQHDRLAELLDTLSPHDEATLGLALRVPLPFIQQLTRHAARNTHSRPAFASA
jgi:DNA-binding MarR family transcriptional regulator